jgi:hypothetical protein
MTVTLDDLVTPSTQPEVLAASLAICTSLGLPTTAWQPIQAIPTVMATNAQIAADASTNRALIAQGGYASYAALMVDGNGNSVTSWMDLIAKENFNVQRNLSTSATGTVPLSNTGGTSYPFTPASPLRFQNTVSGATYATTGTGSVTASSITNVAVTADAAFSGVSGTSGAGVTLTMLTPLASVTVLPLVTSLVGTGAETNAALLARGQSKIASISPNGPSQAYNYIAETIPVGTPSVSPPFAVSAQITRATTHSSPFSGIAQCIVANASGPPNGTDLSVVNQAIQSQVVPTGVLVSVLAATTFTLNLTYTVVMSTSSRLTSAQVLTNVEDALANLMATFPIGGINTNFTGFTSYIPYDQIVTAIMAANPNTVDLSLNAFSGAGGVNGQMLVTDVPVLAAPSASVIFV